MKIRFRNRTSVRMMLAVLALCGCVACGKITHKQPASEAPLPVRTLVVGLCAEALERSYVGEVQAQQALPLSHPLGGELVALHVHNGDKVVTGQAVADFDDTQAKSLHDAAVATLRQAEDAYERLKQVHEGGGLSEVRWVEMQTNLEKARAQEATTAKALSDCHLTAPVAGVVSGLDVHAGQRLLPGQAVCQLVDVNQLQVCFAVPEQEIGLFQKGDTVRVVVPAAQNAVLSARVTDKDVVASPLAHTYDVRSVFHRSSIGLLPGMVAKVLTTAKSQDGVVVPSECVQTTQQGLAVWVVVDGRAVRRVVQATSFVRNGVLVGEGLEPGDEVIIAGYQKLYNGAPVAPTE